MKKLIAITAIAGAIAVTAQATASAADFPRTYEPWFARQQWYRPNVHHAPRYDHQYSPLSDYRTGHGYQFRARPLSSGGHHYREIGHSGYGYGQRYSRHRHSGLHLDIGPIHFGIGR